ncbi:MAG: type II toxin-antitoxin system RelE/ParE family toxin [Bacteroidaceae bacterium]|nr:type II toxin-antitoxin system RelE/ParE family toxin [Bacteroidaceae bacterium]
MTYKVKLTNNALAQLKEAVGYISKVLLEPEVARRWSDRIKKEILTLDHMPLRYPLVDEEPCRTEGIHKLTVENFIVYYWVNEDTSTVWVTAVVYGRRDQLSVLRNMPKE